MIRIKKISGVYVVYLDHHLLNIISISLMLLFFIQITYTFIADAYFDSSATITNTHFTTQTLSFDLNTTGFNSPSIDKGGVSSADVNIINTGSLNFKYKISTSQTGGDSDLCNALKIETKLNNILHDPSNNLLSLSTTPLVFDSSQSIWSFAVNLPASSPDSLMNKKCDFKILYSGWQEEFADNTQGFSSTKELVVSISTLPVVIPPSNHDVVLNEFLPNPSGFKYGRDFGDHHSQMPKGEWVELYNNGNANVDLTGWYIRDNKDIGSHKIMIDKAHTGLNKQIIKPKKFFVVYMNKDLFDNYNGDSVRLFDNNNVLIDSYTYTLDSNYCHHRDIKRGKHFGFYNYKCKWRNEVPVNKSYARIPDGIGDWVDPIPTPGEVNTLEEDPDYEILDALIDETNDVSTDEDMVTFPATPLDEVDSTGVIEQTNTDIPEVIEIPAPPETQEGNTDGNAPSTTDTVPEPSTQLPIDTPTLDTPILIPDNTENPN